MTWLNASSIFVPLSDAKAGDEREWNEYSAERSQNVFITNINLGHSFIDLDTLASFIRLSVRFEPQNQIFYTNYRPKSLNTFVSLIKKCSASYFLPSIMANIPLKTKQTQTECLHKTPRTPVSSMS